MGNTVQEVSVHEVKESKDPIRHTYSDEGLNELASSFLETGVLQQILLRKIKGGDLEVVAGSRRLRAAKIAHLEKMPALVREDVNDKEAILIALAENIHREDLTPFEEARAYVKLTKDYQLTVQDIAKRIGKSMKYISHRIRLLSAVPEVQTMVSQKSLSLDHANMLAGLPLEEQTKFAEIAVKHCLSPKHLRLRIEKETKKRRAGSQICAEKWTGEKVGLEIVTFARFLHDVSSHVPRMTPKGLVEASESLKLCAKEIIHVLDLIDRRLADKEE